MFSVNYSFPSTTPISPYRVASNRNVTEKSRSISSESGGGLSPKEAQVSVANQANWRLKPPRSPSILVLRGSSLVSQCCGGTVNQLLNHTCSPYPYPALQGTQLTVWEHAVARGLQPLEHLFGIQIRLLLQPSQQNRPDLRKWIEPCTPSPSLLRFLTMSRPHFTRSPRTREAADERDNVGRHRLQSATLAEGSHRILRLTELLQQQHRIE